MNLSGTAYLHATDWFLLVAEIGNGQTAYKPTNISDPRASAMRMQPNGLGIGSNGIGDSFRGTRPQWNSPVNRLTFWPYPWKGCGAASQPSLFSFGER